LSYEIILFLAIFVLCMFSCRRTLPMTTECYLVTGLGIIPMVLLQSPGMEASPF